jgi:hypothetical protein
LLAQRYGRYHPTPQETAKLAAADPSLVVSEREPLAVPEAATSTTIVTRLVIESSPEDVWESISFYEQLPEPPPFYLALLLPTPLRVDGKKSAVGDEATCVYDRGYLVKRVTDVDRPRRLSFEVLAQDLEIGRGIELAGGAYTLRPLARDRTDVELATRYTSRQRPRWFWRPIEAAACHLFHRHILRAMRGDAERRSASRRPEVP